MHNVEVLCSVRSLFGALFHLPFVLYLAHQVSALICLSLIIICYAFASLLSSFSVLFEEIISSRAAGGGESNIHKNAARITSNVAETVGCILMRMQDK